VLHLNIQYTRFNCSLVIQLYFDQSSSKEAAASYSPWLSWYFFSFGGNNWSNASTSYSFSPCFDL